MSALTELAERVEQAEGPSRELDREIAVAQGWCLHPDDRQRNDSAQSDTGYTCLDCGADSWGNTGPTGQKRSAPMPAYTASLDAAMTLVPEGWRLDDLKENQSGQFWALLRPREYQGDGPFYYTMSGKSFALALCAAALRAKGGAS